MDRTDSGLAEAAAVAQMLLQGPVDAIDQIRGVGRNSRVYRVRRGGECFAVKHYPPRHNDSRDRLKTEFEALVFMERHGITAVPRPLAIDPGRRYALLSWIDGDAVELAGESDIDMAAGFLAKLHRLVRVAESELQPLGAEACLSGIEIIAQLGRRLARLGCVAAAEAALAELLDRIADFLFSTVLPQVTADYRLLGLSFARPVPIGLQSLCPSDFGFHNALRGVAGLTFIDFEYFGWDDPVKLTCDFLLHPGMRLPGMLKHRFVKATSQIYGADPTFAPRLQMLYPLFALRWCLILLNEFLPERWADRVHAGEPPDWQRAKERQLRLAGELLASVQSNGGSLFNGQ
jgi:Phosphotransferase enzyme family